MKKILASVMIAAMLTVLFVIPAAAERTNVDATALKFASAPTIDGMISVEEWGQASFSVKANQAAVNEDEKPSEYNTYLGHYNDGKDFNPLTAADLDFFSYDVWVRWDDENVYIGAIVNDPTGHSLPQGGKELWNGDVFRFIIDTKGPDAVVAEKDPNLNFNYLTDTYNGRRFRRPWANAQTITNVIMGLVNGINVQVYNDPKDEKLAGFIKEAECAIAVSNETEKEDGSVTCNTTYELRLPWSVIDEEFTPSADQILGMSCCVFESMGVRFNTSLQWGDGIHSDQEQHPKILGGSNALILSAETVTPDPNAPKIEKTEVPTEAPTEAPKSTEPSSEERTTPAPVTNKNINDNNEDGFPVWAWIVIGVAVVAVAAAVVIIIVKKNKKDKK